MIRWTLDTMLNTKERWQAMGQGERFLVFGIVVGLVVVGLYAIRTII